LSAATIARPCAAGVPGPLESALPASTSSVGPSAAIRCRIVATRASPPLPSLAVSAV